MKKIENTDNDVLSTGKLAKWAVNSKYQMTLLQVERNHKKNLGKMKQKYADISKDWKNRDS